MSPETPLAAEASLSEQLQAPLVATPCESPLEGAPRPSRPTAGAGRPRPPEPLREIDDWLAPFRGLWGSHLDDLERHLDMMLDENDPRGG